MIMLSLKSYFVVIMFLGVISFMRGHKHILMTLLSLEFIGVIAYLNLYMNLEVGGSELFLLLVYLTFLVCEGALGLSLLVVQIRGLGSDYMQALSIMKW